MANITALLAALANLPPVSGAAPLTPLPAPAQPPMDFNLPQMLAGPEAPPTAPSMPLDRDLIARIMATGGPAPTPPAAPRPAGILDKIFAVLGGVSAGIQGRGPEYAAGLREERLRPQREYEARQQQYQQQQRQLGLTAINAAESAEDRRQARQDAAAERQFNREFQENMRRMGITDTLAIEKMREAAQIQRDKERERAMDEKLAAQQKAQQERDARTFARDYRRLGAGRLAQELADYDAKLTEQISPAAAKWESARTRLEEARATRLARIGTGGGGGGSSAAAQKAFQQFQGIEQQVAGAAVRGDAAGEQALRRRLTAAFNSLSRFPGQFELGYKEDGITPYAKPKGAAQPTAPLPGEPVPEGYTGRIPQGPPVGDFQPQAAPQMRFDLSGKAPALTGQQRAIFNDIKREQPNAPDAQIIDYMRKKGLLR